MINFYLIKKQIWHIVAVANLLGSLLLIGCGQTGPLTLPVPEPEPQNSYEAL